MRPVILALVAFFLFSVDARPRSPYGNRYPSYNKRRNPIPNSWMNKRNLNEKRDVHSGVRRSFPGSPDIFSDDVLDTFLDGFLDTFLDDFPDNYPGGSPQIYPGRQSGYGQGYSIDIRIDLPQLPPPPYQSQPSFFPPFKYLPLLFPGSCSDSGSGIIEFDISDGDSGDPDGDDFGSVIIIDDPKSISNGDASHGGNDEDKLVEVTYPPKDTNAGGSNAGGSNVGGSNAGGSNTGESNAGGSNAGGSNVGGSNAGGSNTGGSNAGGSNAGGSNAGGSNAGGSNAGGSNTGGSDAGGPNAEVTV